jgi:hypothetical protein
MDNNIIINFLSNNKSILDLSNYTIEEIILIINFHKDKIIGDNQEKLLNNKYDNLENKSKHQLEIILDELWKNFPIFDQQNNPIECSICFSYLTNSDNLLMNCNHQTHSSCFLNYLYSNFISICNQQTNIIDSQNKINYLFRCPKCRNYLTSHIKNNIETTELNESSINTEYEYVSTLNNNINNPLNNPLNNHFNHSYTNNIHSVIPNLNIDLITGL